MILEIRKNRLFRAGVRIAVGCSALFWLVACGGAPYPSAAGRGEVVEPTQAEGIHLERLNLLLEAIMAGDRDRIDRLISKIEKPDAVNEQGYSALSVAAAAGDEKTATELFRIGAGVDARARDLMTPLMVAVAERRTGMVGLLLESGANPNAENVDGGTPLMFACSRGDLIIAEHLAKNGADVNRVDAQKYSPLMITAMRGHLEITKLLLDEDADPSLLNEDGEGAMMLSVFSGKAGVTALLLEEDSREEQRSAALQLACDRGETQIVEVLIDAGVSVDEGFSTKGNCLITAAWNGDDVLADWLFEKGADVNWQTEKGFSALLAAATWNHQGMVERLLDKGGDPKLADSAGHSALGIARSNGFKELSSLLAGRLGESEALVTPVDRSAVSLEIPLECPVDPKATEDTMMMMFSGIPWHPADAPKRWGTGWTQFSEVRTSKAVPIEVCHADEEYAWIASLVCDDGTRPFATPGDAARSRAGSVGGGGRCGAVLDLYVVECPEATYKIYMDMYHCISPM